jgi:hypothetical protein
MVKVMDNELMELWNNSIEKQDNSKNDTFTHFFLKKTNIIELKNAIVIASRKLSDTEYIIMTYKNLRESSFSYTLYSLVIINIDPELPIEKSRIIKYCTISESTFDIINIIVNHRVNQIVNVLNKAIDDKFEALMNNNFNILRYRLGKSEIHNILVKPDRSTFDVPSLSSLMSGYSSIPNVIQEVQFTPVETQEVVNPVICTKKLYENLNIIKNENVNVIKEDDLFKINYVEEPVVIEPKKEILQEIKIQEKPKEINKNLLVSEMSTNINSEQIENILDTISTHIKPKKSSKIEFSF